MPFPASLATHGFLDSPLSVSAVHGHLHAIIVTSLTYFDLLNEVRQLLGDESNTRYPDSMVVNVLNRGLQELARIRPDAFYDLYDSNSLNVPEITDVVPTLDQTIWTHFFELEMRFWPPLVYYVVGMTEVSEDEYVQGFDRHPNNSRAAGSLRLFRRHVLSI